MLYTWKYGRRNTKYTVEFTHDCYIVSDSADYVVFLYDNTTEEASTKRKVSGFRKALDALLSDRPHLRELFNTISSDVMLRAYSARLSELEQERVFLMKELQNVQSEVRNVVLVADLQTANIVASTNNTQELVSLYDSMFRMRRDVQAVLLDMIPIYKQFWIMRNGDVYGLDTFTPQAHAAAYLLVSSGMFCRHNVPVSTQYVRNRNIKTEHFFENDNGGAQHYLYESDARSINGGIFPTERKRRGK